MTLTPFPPAARPMLELIREHVPRPGELPDLYGDKTSQSLRFHTREVVKCCPMGMLPWATNAVPGDSGGFCGLNTVLDYKNLDDLDGQVDAFATWWDAQTDAQAAVDFVWPMDGVAS